MERLEAPLFACSFTALRRPRPRLVTKSCHTTTFPHRKMRPVNFAAFPRARAWRMPAADVGVRVRSADIRLPAKPKFVHHCGPYLHELRKAMALAKLKIQCPFDSKFLSGSAACSAGTTNRRHWPPHDFTLRQADVFVVAPPASTASSILEHRLLLRTSGEQPESDATPKADICSLASYSHLRRARPQKQQRLPLTRAKWHLSFDSAQWELADQICSA